MLISDVNKKKQEMLNTLVDAVLKEGVSGFFSSPDCIKEHLKITDQDIKELVEESVICCNRKEWTSGAEILNWLTFLEPLNSFHFLRFASILLQIERYEQALLNSLKGVVLDPENPEFYLYIGVCLLSLGHPEQAKEAFTLCVELSKDKIEYKEIFETASAAVTV